MIPGAGPVFGAAIDVRRQHGFFHLYNAILRELESGELGSDSYALLADPWALLRFKSLPIGIVTQDGYLGVMDKAELVARMMVMSGSCGERPTPRGA